MRLISIQTVKYIKLFLVSPLTEKWILGLWLVLIPLISLNNMLLVDHNYYNFELYEKLFSYNEFYSINSKNNFIPYFKNNIVDTLLTNFNIPLELI